MGEFLNLNDTDSMCGCPAKDFIIKVDEEMICKDCGSKYPYHEENCTMGDTAWIIQNKKLDEVGKQWNQKEVKQCTIL